ncbi:hypothetical protein [Streptosporangium sp. KLBMP 9127]
MAKTADELYAESYGMWRVDPHALGSHSGDLLSYFEAGKYRNTE